MISLESQRLNNKFINIYTLVSFIIGFITCFVLVFILETIDFTTSDKITIFSIVINLIIAGFIVLFFQKKYSDHREVKNCLIEEIKDIHKEYKDFSNKLINNITDGRFVISWFKVINMKLGHVKYFMKSEINIEDSRLLTLHQGLRGIITSSESFNNSFSQKNIHLSTEVRNTIIEKNRELNHNFLSVIFEIHKN